jgi:hypothetical protein
MEARFFAKMTAAAAAGAFCAFPASARSKWVGTLVCDVPGVIGAVKNKLRIKCSFSRINHDNEDYSGDIETHGMVFVEAVTGTREVWSVEAPTLSVPLGALAGDYKGGVGQVTFVGLGIGGFGLHGENGGAYLLSHGPIDLKFGIGVKYGEISLTLQADRAEPAVNLVAMDAKATIDPKGCLSCAR